MAKSCLEVGHSNGFTDLVLAFLESTWTVDVLRRYSFFWASDVLLPEAAALLNHRQRHVRTPPVEAMPSVIITVARIYQLQSSIQFATEVFSYVFFRML